jgi:hypothetical protein
MQRILLLQLEVGGAVFLFNILIINDLIYGLR